MKLTLSLAAFVAAAAVVRWSRRPAPAPWDGYHTPFRVTR